MGKSITGKSFAAWAMMSLVTLAAAFAPLAGAQSVRQVPTSNRFAGAIVPGYNSDFGTATSTKLSLPTYTVFDASGNLYISDTGNNCVRKVDSSGNISVLAGLVQSGNSDTCNAASATPTAAQGLLRPTGLAIDGNGNLYIADSGHNCVRKLPGGSTGTANLVAVVDTCTNTTTTSVSPSPTGLLLNPAVGLGVAIADQADGISQVILHQQAAPPTSVCIIAGQASAAVATYCPGITGGNVTLNQPQSIAIDPVGNSFVADTGNSCIRELSTANVVSTYLGRCANDGTGTATSYPNFAPVGLVFGPQGYLYISNGDDTVLEYLGGGSLPAFPIFAGISYSGGHTPPPYGGTQEGLAAVDVSLNAPLGLSVDSVGNVYVADSNNGIVRQLGLNTQFPSTALGDSGTPQILQFEIDAPVNLAITTGTDFPIFGNNFTCNGSISPATAGNPPITCSVTLAFTPSAPGIRRSPLTLTDKTTNTPYRFGTTGLGLGANALFTPGTIQTVASPLSTPSSLVVDSGGDAYFAEQGASAGGGDVKELQVGQTNPVVLVAPGGPLTTPSGLALDAAQNLYIADSTANTIFELGANGTVTPFATGLSQPVGVLVDNSGNLIVAQNGSGAVELIKIFAGGQQEVFAGQGTVTAPNNVAASTAQFNKLSGIYEDANGIIYVSDEGALRVYEIDTAGIIHYFAGNGTTTTTNNTVPTQTALLGPAGLTGDAAGDIYIADGGGNLIWLVYSSSNQNPGITQLAGTGVAGGGGDNGPSNVAQLNNPISLALDSSDNLFLIDAGNLSVRRINYGSPTLNFGIIPVGSTAGPLGTTLWDSGNLPLTSLPYPFTAIDSAAFPDVGDGCGFSLQSGSTCNIEFDFTPPAPGSYVSTASANSPNANKPQVITLVGSTPSIQSPNVTVVYGTAYTLSATISGYTGTPAATGTASFSINGVPLCTPAETLDSTGTATCSPSPTLENVGVYTVTVTYTDGTYPPVTQTFTLTVLPAPVTITADDKSRPVNTPNPPLTAQITGVVTGQSIILPDPCCTTTATISSPVGTYPIVPTETVTAGSGTLLSNYAITYVNGTLTITNSGAGSASLTAPPVTAVYGTAYTLSAAITGNQPSAPTGTVTFSIGGAVLCPASTTPAAATCSPSPTLENVGTYTVTVAYSGDSVYPAKTTTLTLTITPAPVTITANNQSRSVSQPNPNPYTGTISGVVAGQSITDTFSSPTAPPSGTGTPGTTFPIVPANPATAGAGTLLSNYSITYVPGTLTITATSSGNAVTLTASPVTTVYGTPYTLIAAVTTSQTPAPTGTVSFSIGGSALCPASTTPAAATCSPSPTLENAGTYQVTVSYSGDTNYAAKTTTLTLTITPAPVTITADSFARPVNGPNPSFTGIISGVVAGQLITDTYTSPTAPASNSGPAGTYAIVPTQPAAAGAGTLLSNYTITYVNGTLTVTASSPGNTAVTIAAPPVNTVYGTAYMLAATVTSAQAPAPTGTLVFVLNGAAPCVAQNLPANGMVTCSPSPTLENAGSYQVTVTYSGDTTYKQTTATFTLTIAPDPVTITANNATRPVNTPNPTFTGTITGNIPAGQSITATYATTALENSPANTYPITPTPVAGPDTLLANYAITINNGTLTITNPGPVGTFTIAATPPEQEIDKTGGVNYSVTLTSVNGFTDQLSLSCSGLPEGGTCSFAPGTVQPTAGGTDTVVMTVGATVDSTNVPDGTYGALHMPQKPGSHGPQAWLGWTLLPLGFGGTLMASRRRRKRWMQWMLLPILVVGMGLGMTMGLSGCSPAVNYKIYTITVTATDTAFPTYTQSTTVTLTLAR